MSERESDPEVGRQRDRLDQHLALASATSCNTTLRNPSRPHHTRRVHQESDSCLLLLVMLTAIKCSTMCLIIDLLYNHFAEFSIKFHIFLFCFGPYVALGSAGITKIVYIYWKYNIFLWNLYILALFPSVCYLGKCWYY